MDKLRERLDALRTEILELAETAELTEAQEARYIEANTEFDQVEAELATATERAARVEKVRSTVIPAAETRTEEGDAGKGAPNVIVRTDGFEVLDKRDATPVELRDAAIKVLESRVDDADNMAHVEGVLKRHLTRTATDETRAWARNLVARSQDVYVDAFAKGITGNLHLLDNEERAALSVGSNTNGGFLVPTHLDPTIILTNSGTDNPYRQISRAVTLVEGNVWNGVTSAGVTASYDAELAEVSDDSPTFGRASISTHKAQAFVQGSIEAFQDISALSSDVLMLFADARDRLEGAAFATGTGSGQPFGIFTALDANTNVEIISTTAATIGLVDLHGVYRSVPVRFRGKSKWVMNPLYSLAIKALGTAISASYSGDLRDPTAGRILGHDVVESDDAPTTQTTTVNDNELIFGDFSNYVLVDKPGSMSVEFIPHLFATANNLPDGRRGWYAYWRHGADSVNDLAFRLLQDKTSA